MPNQEAIQFTIEQTKEKTAFTQKATYYVFRIINSVRAAVWVGKLMLLEPDDRQTRNQPNPNMDVSESTW